METTTGTDVLPVIHMTTESDEELIAGVISAGVLSQHYIIDRRDARHGSGYQREISAARVNSLVRDLKDGKVDLPTSVLLNLRDYDRAKHFNEAGDFVLHAGDRLYVVDGQHRIEALARLFEDDPDRWRDYMIPFTSFLGVPFGAEVKQFYVVNSTAKSVRTDLALDLLKQRAESEPGVMESLVESGQAWKVAAQRLTEKLEQTPIWRGLVRLPGDPRAGTTIRSSGMVSSLKQVVQTPFFSALGTDKQLEILDAYWRGIKKVIPEPFEDPNDYVIQKTTGVMVMHGLLVSVIEYIRSAGRSLLEPEPYAETIHDALVNLEGDTITGGRVSGSDFWLSGEEGAAGSYSSNAGRRVLVARLRGSLPELQVE